MKSRLSFGAFFAVIALCSTSPASAQRVAYTWCATPRTDEGGGNLVTYVSAVFATTASWLDTKDFDQFVAASHDQRRWNSRRQCPFYGTLADAVQGRDLALVRMRSEGRVVITDWRAAQ